MRLCPPEVRTQRRSSRGISESTCLEWHGDRCADHCRQSGATAEHSTEQIAFVRHGATLGAAVAAAACYSVIVGQIHWL